MNNIKDCFNSLEEQGSVLDVGCLNFRITKMGEKLRPGKLRYFGVDYVDPDSMPEGFIFKKADLNHESLPFEDDSFDLVLAIHVLEHIKDPIAFFSECIRVCKPGGKIYFETPSERSLLLPGMPFQHDLFYSLSFFDDPTHTSRPWSPQSLYRLTKLFGCNPLKVRYMFTWLHRLALPFILPLALIIRNGRLLQHIVWNAVGWTSCLIAEKPLHIKGAPQFKYYIPR